MFFNRFFMRNKMSLISRRFDDFEFFMQLANKGCRTGYRMDKVQNGQGTDFFVQSSEWTKYRF